MANLSASERDRWILLMAVEDHSGLWLLEWQLNTVDPDGSPSSHRVAAAEAVRSLLRRGWVQGFQLDEQWEPHAVSEGELLLTIATESEWEPRLPGEAYFAVSATPEGERAYWDNPL